MRVKRAVWMGIAVAAVGSVGCTKTFDLTPPRASEIRPPERRGAAEGFKNDARLKEATRILILTPDAMAAGVRHDGPPYDSGVAFVEAALLAQGKVPVIGARIRPHTGSVPAVCSSEKACEAQGDDMEHLLALGREARADLILQLATALDAEPVLARYVDAKTGDILLVGKFFAKPGQADVTRAPDEAEFNAACFRAGGIPRVDRKPESGGPKGYCAIRSAGGEGEVEANALSREMPDLLVHTKIPASRERTIAEALVAPLGGGN